MRDENLLALLTIVAVACRGSASNATTGTGGSGSPPAQPPATSGTGGSAAPAPPAPGTRSVVSAAPAALAAPAAPPPSAKELRATLLEAAGDRPVLLALDAKGQLVARTVDGAFTRVLVPGPYGDAAPDAERDLVWLRDDHKLDVLDLRGKAVAPVTVVTFPDKAMAQLGQHLTEPPSWVTDKFVNVMLATPCGKATGLRLEWATGESTAAWAKGFRAVAKDWLAAEDKRTKHALGPDPFPSTSKQRKVPRDVGTCRADAKEEYGKSRCGEAMPFGATGAELVITGAGADRCPASQCGLYDPKAKQFSAVPGFDPGDEAAPSCGPFLFDRAGTSFLVGEQACGPDLTCGSVGRLAIGWLEGNRALGKE